MPGGTTGWHLERFEERLDAWDELEKPPDDLRLLVVAWIFTRWDNPYEGVERESGFHNLWFGPVPGSSDGLGHVVICSYWVDEHTRTVRCDNFATLAGPV